MGNQQSSPSKSSRRSKKKKNHPDTASDVAKSVFGEFTSSIQSGMRKIEDSALLDTVCGTLMDEKDVRSGRSHSYAYSEDMSIDDSRTLSEDETLDEYDRRRKSRKKSAPSDSESLSLEDDTSEASKKKTSSKRSSRRDSHDSESFISEDSSMVDPKKSGKGVVTESTPEVGLSKPLASSFAKRCYFTKAGIGKTTQHYEGLTLTGNVVLMLAGAMKLKGCPTICDEDLRRVEQTYPNQFSRLPDELLLSSGWRRISKYCHFSNKPIPDGVPFFHSKQRIHPSGGYYFLLAAAVGMVRPIEVEPLTRDTLVLLETDYPTQCDAAPDILVQDPSQWTLVDKFCFFSGGPINTEEDVYYQADFDGNLIFMLAFLSPSLTPEELYKLGPAYQDEPGLKTIAEVEEVESVYDLTDRDFDDLKLYHLGPCRALPPYILQPSAWTKVLPPHFLAAKQQAAMKAEEFEQRHAVASPAANTSAEASGTVSSSIEAGETIESTDAVPPKDVGLSPPEEEYHPPAAQETAPDHAADASHPQLSQDYPLLQQDMSHATTPQSEAQSYAYESVESGRQFGPDGSFLREVQEEGAFIDSTVPMDEAIDARRRKRGHRPQEEEPRGPGSLIGSEAGTSYTGGSSYVETVPADQPPRYAMQDVPDDEGRYQDEYTESSRHTQFSEDEEPYDASKGDVRSPASGAPNGYHHDGEYYQSDSRETGDSSGYYEREEEYYDSPEKGHLRVHTALEQHAEFGQSPAAGSQPGFIYSQESGSEFSTGGGQGYYHDNGGYDKSQGESVYSPASETQADSLEADVDGRSGEGMVSTHYDSKDNVRTAPTQEENEDDRATEPEEKAPQETYLPTRSGFRSTRPNSIASPRGDYSVGESSTSMSEYSQTSAMRGAQELLKKNRQKRLELATRKHKGGTTTLSGSKPNGDEMKSPRKNKNVSDDDASATTSLVSGSSVWTDASGADRGSRRALILQMAKARMKSNKATATTSESNFAAPIAEESSAASGDHTSDAQSKTTAPTKVSEMDLAGELD